jgi:hypothetical protein
MKLIVATLLLLPFGLLARNADSTRHGLGIIGETNAMFVAPGNVSMNSFGLQYTKKTRKHFSYNIIAGYSDYLHRPVSSFSVIKGDTATSKTINTNMGLGILGFGVEVERRFYKKLYFFAGLEVRAGYGVGSRDTTLTKEYNETMPNPYGGPPEVGFTTSSTGISGPDATMFYAGFTPYAGLKIDFKRFSVGTSFMNFISYTSLHVKGAGADNMLDFDTNNIMQRFFVAYKF